MGESHHDNSGQVHYSREKSNNRSFTGHSKYKNLTCNYSHKKGHIRSECWLRKKKQPDANIIELVEGGEEECDILSVTDKPAGSENRWVIDSRCSKHISSNRKIFFSYISVQRGEVFIGNSSTSKVIGEGTIQFWSDDGCITTFPSVRHVLNQGTISSLLEPYIEKILFQLEKWSYGSFQRDPCDVSSQTCRQCIYVVKFRGYSWWIAVILGFRSSGCGTIGDYDRFDLRCSIVLRKEIGTRRATR